MMASIPGGKYTALDNGDGTWTIKDVPVMGTLQKGQKKTPFDITKDWLEKAVVKSQELFKAKYLSPLHVRHHDFGAKTERAGFVLFTKVGKTQCEGKEIDAIYADLINVPDAIFKKIDKAEVPYRSVEIVSWENPELASLALLEDDVPFFRFELLTIGEKIPRAFSGEQFHAESFAESESPAMAYMTTGNSSLVLFRFKDKPVKDGDKSGIDPSERGHSDAKKDKELIKKELGKDGKESGGACCSHCDMIEDVYNKMQGAYQMKPEENKPVEQAQPGASRMSEDIAGKFAALEGQIAALLQEKGDRDAKVKTMAIYDAAEKELAGINLHEDSKKALKMASEHGEESAKAFVAAFKANVPKDPPKTMTEYAASTAGDKEPDAVLKHLNVPEKLKRAKEYVKLYADVKSSRMTEMSLNDWVELQMRRDESIEKGE